MAFENLSERLQNAIKMFRGSGKITEDDLKAPLREVRMALLEADVNFKVVKDFVANIFGKTKNTHDTLLNKVELEHLKNPNTLT